MPPVTQLLVVIEPEQKWEENPMSARQQTELSRSNQNATGGTCSHCAGVAVHETWCVTRNAFVRYAYAAISGNGRLTLGDKLSLHGLGVAWTGEVPTEEIRRP